MSEEKDEGERTQADSLQKGEKFGDDLHERKNEAEAVNTKSASFKRYMKGFVRRYFIDAFSGMALGLFCTLIVGTIVAQIGALIGDNVAGKIIAQFGAVAKLIMGAGIGIGIAHSLKAKKLTSFSAAVAGMIGANIVNIFAMNGVAIYGAPANPSITIGDPVASYIAAVFAIEIADLAEGKTKVDILVVPIVAVFAGAAAAIVLGIPFNMLFTLLGKAISYATQIEPISMGIIVAAVMGLLLTFPTSSAAFGVMLFQNTDPALLHGTQLAAGAAVAGCCAHMVGFAVASFRENKWGGLVSQGIGTSMLQIPNIAKNFRILIPAVAASIVAGPLSSAAFGLYCNAVGSGMGTAGLVGVIQTFAVSIAAGMSWWYVTLAVLVVQFLVPTAVAFAVSEFLRKKNWIRFGDMKLNV